MHRRTRPTLGAALALGGALTLARPGKTASVPPPPLRVSLPALVWIQPRSRIPDWRRDDVREARRAFTAWSGVTPSIRFAVTSDSAAAEVQVWWVDRFDEPVSGESRLMRDPLHGVTGATVRLAVHHRDGRELDADAMRALAMHEVGHLLGLGHSDDPASIMAPTVRVRALSPGDSARLRQLYGEVPRP
jgi:hypothetical protein